MRRITQLIAAVAAASALILSACGSSDSTPKQRNSAIAQEGEGLNMAVYKIKQGKGNMENSKNYGYGSFKNLTKYYEDHATCEGANTFTANIDSDWAREVIENCDREWVLIHYTGFITVPGTPGEKVSVTFRNRSDDGFWLEIDGSTVIDNWDLQPCGGRSTTVSLEAGTKLPFNSWYFENGDWACNSLYWTLPNAGEVAVPPSAFSPTKESKIEENTTSTSSSIPGDDSTTSTSDAPEDKVSTTSSTIDDGVSTNSEDSTTSSVAGGSGSESENTTTTEGTVVKQIIVDDTTPITVPEGAKEIACDSACVESIRTTLGVTGDVYATVAGKKVLLDGKTAIPTNGTEVVFSDGADKSITVAFESLSEGATPVFDSESGSGSSFPWWIVIVAIIVLAGGGYTASTRKKKVSN